MDRQLACRYRFPYSVISRHGICPEPQGCRIGIDGEFGQVLHVFKQLTDDAIPYAYDRYGRRRSARVQVRIVAHA
ncbi:hypothetical protein D3C78_1958840 [compost metagenome]